jgi:2'-5' RNA ligase
MRLFTALDISDDVRAALVELLRQLSPAARFQWSPPENLHITTKFIGNWPEEKLAELTGALAGVRKPGPIEIKIAGLGWVPNPHSPRVLFAGVYADASLPELHHDIEMACAGIGIPAEAKNFNPHMTLARIKSPEGLPAVRQLIAQLPTRDFGQFAARAFHLYQSVPVPGGTEYKKLEEFPLL